MVQAFIIAKLDYCNSLLGGLPQRALCKLHVIQHSAALLISGKSFRTYITPALKQLHWLFHLTPVFITYWQHLSLNHWTQSYHHPAYGRPRSEQPQIHKSTSSRKLFIPRTNKKVRDCAFATCSPRLCNIHVQYFPLSSLKQTLWHHLYVVWKLPV